MRGRALLLGSQTGTLTGVSNDVQAMARWLDGLGLTLDVREGPQATRDGMLDGLARLVRDARRGEPAVVYYSGHGGFSSVRSEQRLFGQRFAPRAFQYLVPTDHDKLRSFRGIFRAELSSAIRDLSDRTSNITVILDCCHSTDMVRDDDLALKAVVEPWSEGVEAHVEWLVEQGYDLERLPELRNPALVLVSACTAARKAFEYTRPADGMRCGVLTDCLLDVASRARELGRVTWDGLVRRVVDRARGITVHQRPQVSGPSSRRLFSERREQRSGALTLELDVDRWRLSGGAAVGIVRGDRYCIVDPLAEDPTRPLAEAEVTDVTGHVAGLSLVTDASRRPEPGMIAVPSSGGPTHQRCRIEGTAPWVEELRRRLVEVPGLAVAEASDRSDVAFVLRARGEELDVLDGAGRRLRWPWRDAPELEPRMRSERLDALVQELHALARGSDLLSLARRSACREAVPSLPHGFEWGRVDDGIPTPLPLRGAELTVGDRIYVSVENTGSRAIHVSLLDVGVGRNVVLMNRNEPEGIDLASGDTELFGAPEARELRGIELAWSDDVPPDGPLEESLVVFVSSGPLPVASWASSSPHEDAKPRIVRSEVRRSQGPVYVVHHVSFLLLPRK